MAGGGKLIAHSWQVEATAAHPLWASLGVDFVSTDVDPPDPVHWWEPDHPLFTDPEAVPELTDLEGFRYGVYGTHVEALDGARALAGFAEAPTPSAAAVVLGDEQRTLFRGFLDGQNDADRDADGTRDGVELWIDSIVGIEQGFFVDVPWLDVAPDSGTLEPGEDGELEVTIDTTDLEVGVYGASIVLDTSAARQRRVTIPVRLVVTPYMQGVNRRRRLHRRRPGRVGRGPGVRRVVGPRVRVPRRPDRAPDRRHRRRRPVPGRPDRRPVRLPVRRPSRTGRTSPDDTVTG